MPHRPITHRPRSPVRNQPKWPLREVAIVASTLAAMTFHGQQAHAAAINGQGTWETTLQGRDLDENAANGFEAYYDTVLNITWLKNADFMRTSGASASSGVTWQQANTWARNLSVEGLDGWRLPLIRPLNGRDYNLTFAANGTTDIGQGITSKQSELAHLFNVTLGNLGATAFNTGGFVNLRTKASDGFYWSGSASRMHATLGQEHMIFTIGSGQASAFEQIPGVAWAVRDGDAGLLVSIQWATTASGTWDAASNWNRSQAPVATQAVTIDPTRSLTITGPATSSSMKSLALGGDGSGNLGIATLNLIGSTLTASKDINIRSQGIVLGEGTLAGANIVNHGLVQAGNVVFNALNSFLNQGTVGGQVSINTASFTNQGTLNGSNLQVNSPTSTNHGTINATRGSFAGVLTNLGLVQVNQLTVVDGVDNQGTLTGHGQLNGSVTNYRNGMVKVNAGQRLEVTQWAQNNAGGTFDLVGGDFQTTADSLNNQSGGRILMGNGTRLSAGGPGLINQGQVLMSYGTASVNGQVTNAWGGQIIASGNSNITFYDNTELQTGSEVRVSQGSSVTFFGLVEQRTGANLTGTGSKFFEGGLSVGASPGLGTIAGDVGFGLGNELLIELGGDTACTLACATDNALKDSSHDKLVVGGQLTLGGTLRLVSWNSFVAQAGMRFDVLDWGSLDGTFDSIDTTAFRLAGNTRLDLSKLYVDGSVSVLSTTPAVPEPQTWALAMAGAFICLLGTSRKRPV